VRPQDIIEQQDHGLGILELQVRPLVPCTGRSRRSHIVRILLVSADFGREITTTVLWLNGFEGMDIRCVRLIPYKVADDVLVDIQQVPPTTR
jgi:hypothetical protein